MDLQVIEASGAVRPRRAAGASRAQRSACLRRRTDGGGDAGREGARRSRRRDPQLRGFRRRVGRQVVRGRLSGGRVWNVRMIPEAERETLLGIAREAISVSLGGLAEPAHGQERTGRSPCRRLRHPAHRRRTSRLHRPRRGRQGAGRRRGVVRGVGGEGRTRALRRSVAANSGAARHRDVGARWIRAGPSLADIDVGRPRSARRGRLAARAAAAAGRARVGMGCRQFVAQTCRKAGLPSDAWPSRGATLYRFEAEVFGEHARRRWHVAAGHGC